MITRLYQDAKTIAAMSGGVPADYAYKASSDTTCGRITTFGPTREAADASFAAKLQQRLGAYHVRITWATGAVIFVNYPDEQAAQAGREWWCREAASSMTSSEVVRGYAIGGVHGEGML